MQVLAARVLLRPADFDAAVAFYEDQLGLTRYREFGGPDSRGIVYFLGGGFLELTEGGGEPPRGVRLWLQVPDLEAACADLAGKGVAVAAPPERKPWGLLEASIYDPDGLELVLVEVPPEHPLRRDPRS